MGLSDLFGNLGDFGSQPLATPPMGNQGLAAALPTQDANLHRGFFQQLDDPHSSLRTGIGGFLGHLGDFLLAANGHEPMYEPRQQQNRLKGAVAQFLGPSSGLNAIAKEDPNAAIQLWSAMRKPELPAGLQEFAAYHAMTPDQRTEYQQFKTGDPSIATTLPGDHFYAGPMSGLGAALTQFTKGQGSSPAAGQPPQGGQPPQPQVDAPTILKQATARGYVMPDEMMALRQSLGPNGQGAMEGWLQQNHVRTVTRTGTSVDGRKVVQFSDGTVDYAN